MEQSAGQRDTCPVSVSLLLLGSCFAYLGLDGHVGFVQAQFPGGVGALHLRVTQVDVGGRALNLVVAVRRRLLLRR